MLITSRSDLERGAARRSGAVTVLSLHPRQAEAVRVELVLVPPGARHTAGTVGGGGSAAIVLAGAGELSAAPAGPGTVGVAGPGAQLEVVASSGLELLVVSGDVAMARRPPAPQARVFALEEVPERVAHDPAMGFYDMRARRLLDDTGDGCPFCLGVGTFAARSGCHDLHRHASAAEFFYVWDGSGVHLGPDGAPHPVRAGDLVHVPAGEWHGFRNTGDRAARAVFGYLGVERFANAGYEVFQPLAHYRSR